MPTETHTDLGDGLGLPLAGIRKDMEANARETARQSYSLGYQQAIIDAYDAVSDHLPFREALKLILMGMSDCAAAVWDKRFGGAA